MAKRRKPEKRDIDTGGGAHVSGNVNTGGGDFVGRDKKVTATGPGSIAVGGSVTGSQLVTGSGNVIVDKIETVFAPIYRQIDTHPALPPGDKADLKAETQDLEAELKKGDAADEGFLARRLRNIRRMAPDILDVILAAMGGPAPGFGMVAKKVAEEMKRSGGG